MPSIDLAMALALQHRFPICLPLASKGFDLIGPFCGLGDVVLALFSGKMCDVLVCYVLVYLLYAGEVGGRGERQPNTKMELAVDRNDHANADANMNTNADLLAG
jgi:hypothetical protein